MLLRFLAYIPRGKLAIYITMQIKADAARYCWIYSTIAWNYWYIWFSTIHMGDNYNNFDIINCNDYDNNHVTNDENHNGNSHTIDNHDDEDDTIRAIQKEDSSSNNDNDDCNGRDNSLGRVRMPTMASCLETRWQAHDICVFQGLVLVWTNEILEATHCGSCLIRN